MDFLEKDSAMVIKELWRKYQRRGLEYDVSEGDSGEVEKKYAHAMCRRN